MLKEVPLLLTSTVRLMVSSWNIYILLKHKSIYDFFKSKILAGNSVSLFERPPLCD